MKSDLGVSLVLLRPLAQGIARLGGDPIAFLAELGVTKDTDIDAYIPGERVAAALAKLPFRERLGLGLAHEAPIGSLGFMDYLFVASSNLREALGRCARFYGLVTQLVSPTVEETSGRFSFSHTLNPGAPRVVVLTEFAFALLVVRARAAVGSRFRLRAVRFTHRVADPEPFHAFFGVKVAFGAQRDELVFDADAAALPFPTAELTTVAFLEAQAVRRQATLATVGSFHDRARAAIVHGLRNRRCDVASIARELRLSTRNLQRLLQQHGTSHRELVADVQRELAEQLLTRRDLSIAEVAYELGFTQQSAFHRAFTRWTGRTPGEVRRSVAGRP